MEIQGPYGPVSIAERVLHLIWRDLDFDQRHLQTTEQEPLRIVNPGHWNHHEGPDFRNARLLIGETEIVGDVELHFTEHQWRQHGHQADPNFDHVVLHVILFPHLRAEFEVITTSQSRALPTLVLLPHLHRDLESYATQQAMAEINASEENALANWLKAHEAHARVDRLRYAGQTRYRQKLAFAHERLRQHEWPEACHHLALEVLGYRRNREAMSAIAQRYPLGQWDSLDPEAVFQEFAGQWHLAGVRPENHPQKRLHQYQRLCRKRPDWPKLLKAWGDGLPAINAKGMTTRQLRRQYSFNAARDTLIEEVFAFEISGSRLDTLTCDALLPLLSAFSGRSMLEWWYHWFGGDMPDVLMETLKQGECFNLQQPICNGSCQAGLQLLLEGQCAVGSSPA